MTLNSFHRYPEDFDSMNSVNIVVIGFVVCSNFDMPFCNFLNIKMFCCFWFRCCLYNLYLTDYLNVFFFFESQSKS